MKSAKRGFLFFLGFLFIDWAIIRVLGNIFGFPTWLEWVLFIALILILYYLVKTWTNNQLRKLDEYELSKIDEMSKEKESRD